MFSSQLYSLNFLSVEWNIPSKSYSKEQNRINRQIKCRMKVSYFKHKFGQYTDLAIKGRILQAEFFISEKAQ